MTTVFINPGTEASDTATEDNALRIAERICADTGSTASRHPETDGRGWFGSHPPHQFLRGRRMGDE